MGFPSSNSTVISSPDFPDVANITYPAKRVTLLVVIGVVKFVVEKQLVAFKHKVRQRLLRHHVAHLQTAERDRSSLQHTGRYSCHFVTACRQLIVCVQSQKDRKKETGNSEPNTPKLNHHP